MKFSILTPSYNQGRFISDCIESVKIQLDGNPTFQVEHLVLDACSTDETLLVLKQHPHLEWKSEPDKGQSDAINKGFLAASGDWVMWLNADDYLLPNALEKVARFIEQHPEADVVYGGWNFVDAKGEATRKNYVFPFDLGMVIHYGPYLASTACFFRRSTVIGEGFLLNPHFRYNMDGEFYSRLGRAGKRFFYLPELLAGFRVHGQNVSYQYQNQSGIDGLLRRQLALAEGTAIKRAYGITLFHHPVGDSVVDAMLWAFYRVKKILLKVIHGSYSK